MTTAYERMRAVGWGGELLGQICSDASLPATVVARAKRIALTYPTAQMLDDWLRSGAVNLTPQWTAALSEARTLFEELGIGGLGSPATREDLRYTLRHFPDEQRIRVMSLTSSLSWWLQLDR